MYDRAHSTIGPNLIVRPDSARVDERVIITLNQLTPHQLVTLHARTIDDNGTQWNASATYQADEHGQVDVSTQEAISGTYNGREPMGIFWSMYPQQPEQQQTLYAKTTLQPIEIQLTLESEGDILTESIHRRHFLTADIQKTSIEEQGIVGTFFHPTRSGRYPCIILLSGSSGAIREPEAALLASHGYCTLAAAYFGKEPLPQELQEIPLEYIYAIIQWLQNSPVVQEQNIAIMGISKGGELALLAATIFPEITAVICHAPSAVIHQGLGTPGANDDQGRSSWTYQGKQLPFLPYHPSSGYIKYINKQRDTGKPVACINGYIESLQNRTALSKATIPVEKMHVPLLLISGQTDEMWPSTLFGNMIEQRLDAHAHPYPYQHLRYEEAGHKIAYPYIPTTINCGRGYAYGGSPRGNAYANEYSWQAVLAFLDEHFHQRHTTP